MSPELRPDPRGLLDEDRMDRRLIRAMLGRRMDVIMVADVGLRGRADSEILAKAGELGRVVYTCNGSDFARLHVRRVMSDELHAGIIVNPVQRLAVGEQVRRIVRIFDAHDAEGMVNRLEWLSDWAELP